MSSISEADWPYVGITLIYKRSTVMGCVARWSSMILRTLIAVCMTLIMVCPFTFFSRILLNACVENTVITLSDWYHVVSTLGPKFPTSDSTLINGLGRYAGGPSSPLSIISVRKGRRYRFRVFSLSCDPNYVFSIDRHSLTVIEADGVTSKPFIVDSLTIYAGQRYSVILNANQTVKNYWIRANPNFGPVGFANGIDSAILRYRGAPAIEPTTVQLTSLAPLQESSLIPYKNPGVAGKRYPGGADVNINLAIEFDFNTFGFTVNGLSYKSPTAPVLLQILSGAQTAQDLMPTGSVYELPSNKVIDISMPGGALAGPVSIFLSPILAKVDCALCFSIHYIFMGYVD